MPAARPGRRRITAAAALSTAAALAALTGCGTLLKDASCGGGEYPVLAVGTGGSACVPDGEEPGEGWARYPEGKVPRHVDDKWDVYWRTRTVDEHGETVDLPPS
ncbi:SCO0607 family lipoprotein [Streptomyces sp. NPDC058953]|uniref:SCO0607 family lipoprotein n=1 Tax=unclassified Streptomyces TaxID=2593676 RepID=UPI0036BD815E